MVIGLETPCVVMNPCRGEIAGQVDAWVRRMELGDDAVVARLAGYDCASYAAGVLPAAPAPVVGLCADYFAWLIAFDDAVGECQCEADLVRLMRTIVAFEASWHGLEGSLRLVEAAPFLLREVKPFLRAVCDLRERGTRLAARPVEWRARFHADILDYLHGCLAEAPYRIHRVTPAQTEYSAFRMRTIGAAPVLDIAELAFSEDLPSAARTDAITLFALANDIVSHRACETERDDEDRLNFVTVTVADRRCSLREARLTLAARYEAMRHELASAAARDLVDGNLHWYLSQRAFRYR